MTILHFLASGVLLVSLIGLIWPFVIYPAILSLLPARPATARGMPGATTVSLLFCAYNEAAALPGKIANLRVLKARLPDLEILAYDDGSTDATAALLHGASDILIPVAGPGRMGKAHGMKTLAARASGDILVFTDANVTFADDAIERILAPYADPLVGGVLGSLRYQAGANGPTALVGSLYWRMEERLKTLESRCGNVMGADGSIFSIRRALYPDFPDTVLDDLTVSMAVVFAGRRLVKATDAIAYEGPTVERSDEFRRKIRIAARAWHTHGYLRPMLRRMRPLDRFKYASRKLVRWLGAPLILAAAAAALVLVATLSLPGAAIALAGMTLFVVIALRAKRGPLAVLADLLAAYVAVAIGGWRALRGATFATWTPPVSR